VSCDGVMSIYRYTVRQHDISRLDYADFIKTDWNVNLGFVPTTLGFCELLICATDQIHLAVITVSSCEYISAVVVDGTDSSTDMSYLQKCRVTCRHLYQFLVTSNNKFRHGAHDHNLVFSKSYFVNNGVYSLLVSMLSVNQFNNN